MILVDKEFVENTKCKIVLLEEIDEYESKIIPKMKDLMINNNGCGLALPQVGIDKRMFIMRYGNEIISCYNPTWTPKNKKIAISREGCLTYLPTKENMVNVLRYKIIYVEFLNSEKIKIRMKLRGLDAIIFQHEAEHLNGITIFNKKIN